jgi:hypothetical protein
MPNEQFIRSHLLGRLGQLFTIARSFLILKYGMINRFKMEMDNTYGDKHQEMGEHGHVTVTFFKE